MLDFLRRLLGHDTPRRGSGRIFLCTDSPFATNGVYTDADFAKLRQIVIDLRFLHEREDRQSRIYWATNEPVPGYNEYVVVRWSWFGYAGGLAARMWAGTFDLAVQHAGALQRVSTNRDHRYSVAVDVTDAVMAREPGYV